MREQNDTLEVKKFQAICLTLLIIIAIALTGCDKTRVYEDNQDITNYKWEYKDVKSFTAEITDTTKAYNLYVNVRHGFQYEWRNMYVNITTVFPDGKSLQKRVSLELSEADGHWFGKCTGDNCDMQVPLQMGARFPQTGKYTFKISQDMRVNPLPNMKAIGFRIETAQ